MWLSTPIYSRVHPLVGVYELCTGIPMERSVMRVFRLSPACLSPWPSRKTRKPSRFFVLRFEIPWDPDGIVARRHCRRVPARSLATPGLARSRRRQVASATATRRILESVRYKVC